MVASIVLSPSSASTNAELTTKNAGAVPSGAGCLLVGEGVTAQRPQPEEHEHRAGDDAEQMRGQRRTEVVADRDREDVHGGGGDGDRREHHPPAVPQREHHRHQLGLVTQLGDEDHGEAQQQGGEHSRLLGSVAAGSGIA